MSKKDEIKWNEKYRTIPKLLEQRDVSSNLKEAIAHSKIGMALDVACGAGKNSIYLAKKGFEVESYDISKVALTSLDDKNYKNITTICQDLDGFIPTKNRYDFAVMTNFLDRELIPKLAKALKPNGILFIETYMQHDSNEKKSSNSDYLLSECELKTFFDNSYKVLDYGEFDNEVEEQYRMKKQFIIIKKFNL